MKSALLVIALALLAGACAKKQQAAKSPAPADQTMDADKAASPPPAPDAKEAPARTQRNEDPCTGGEQPR